MPPLKHATLSVSSAHRWLECPPSALLEKDMPDESSVHAAEGSAAHEVAEYKVRCYLGEKNLMPPTTGDFDAKEIDRHTDTYLFYVTERIEEIVSLISIINSHSGIRHSLLSASRRTQLLRMVSKR